MCLLVFLFFSFYFFKVDNKLKKEINSKLDKLAQQFIDQTDSVVEDAAYEVKKHFSYFILILIYKLINKVSEILADRIKKGKTQLKLRWKDVNNVHFSE